MKKQWLVALVGLTMALAAITCGGFVMGSSESDDPQVGISDEWDLVEVPGWPDGFSLRLPQGWILHELQGIDSYVGEIVWDGGRLNYDFGWYSSSLVDEDDSQYVVFYEEIGGRRAKLVRPRTEGQLLITGVYFEDVDGSNQDIPSQNRLQISGVGLTPDQQETAFSVFRTIRALRSDPQGDSDPSGRPIATSIDDVDPDECNWIHNITACKGPSKEETIVEPEPYPMPAQGKPNALPYSDVQCGTDQAISIASGGQVSCWDINILGQTDDGKDMVPPAIIPEPEPSQ